MKKYEHKSLGGYAEIVRFFKRVIQPHRKHTLGQECRISVLTTLMQDKSAMACCDTSFKLSHGYSRRNMLEG